MSLIGLGEIEGWKVQHDLDPARIVKGNTDLVGDDPGKPPVRTLGGKRAAPPLDVDQPVAHRERRVRSSRPHEPKRSQPFFMLHGQSISDYDIIGGGTTGRPSPHGINDWSLVNLIALLQCQCELGETAGVARHAQKHSGHMSLAHYASAMSAEEPEGDQVELPTLELFQHVADLWTNLRRFAQATERAARIRGLTPQRYRLLLMIKGAPSGDQMATVGQLTERLHLAQSTITELIDRAEAIGLVVRSGSPRDGRLTEIRLTDEGDQRLIATITDLAIERRQFATLVARLKSAL
jgi:DNA-binding MarR family transcriptional regulator